MWKCSLTQECIWATLLGPSTPKWTSEAPSFFQEITISLKVCFWVPIWHVCGRSGPDCPPSETSSQFHCSYCIQVGLLKLEHVKVNHFTFCFQGWNYSFCMQTASFDSHGWQVWNHFYLSSLSFKLLQGSTGVWWVQCYFSLDNRDLYCTQHDVWSGGKKPALNSD